MSDTDSNKGRGSPESVADSAAADQQATEIEQLKKQLEAANLQLRDKDDIGWLQQMLTTITCKNSCSTCSRRETLSAFCRKEHRSGSSVVLHLHLLSVLCQISDQWTLIKLHYWKWLISGTGASSLQLEAQQ